MVNAYVFGLKDADCKAELTKKNPATMCEAVKLSCEHEVIYAHDNKHIILEYLKEMKNGSQKKAKVQNHSFEEESIGLLSDIKNPKGTQNTYIANVESKNTKVRGQKTHYEDKRKVNTDNARQGPNKAEPCYTCGQIGHWRAECPQNNRRSQVTYDKGPRPYNNNRSFDTYSQEYAQYQNYPNRSFQGRQTYHQNQGSRQDVPRDERYCDHCEMPGHFKSDCNWHKKNIPCPRCDRCNGKGHFPNRCNKYPNY